MNWTVSSRPPCQPATTQLARSATPVVHIADIDSDNLSDTATDPDNEPVVVQPRRRRRLVLVPQPSGGTQQSVQDLPRTAIDTPDTHDDRSRRVRQALQPQGIPSEVVQGGTPQMLHRQARAAQILIQELSRRVGSVPGGSSIPRIVREQRWSLLNVPLMWAAAGQDPSTPVLEWLIFTIANFSAINFNGGLVEAGEAAMIGWTSLRAAMRSWGITTEQDLSAWLRRQGFPGPQPGNHIAQFVLAEGCRFDARVAMLEAVFVTTTLEFGRQTIPAREQPNEILTGPARDQGRSQRDASIPNLDFFDDVDLEGLFAERVPMLKSCPYFFRGRLRNLEAFRTCAQNVDAQSPGDWECGPRRSRFERRTLRQGQVAELLASARNSIPTGTLKSQSARSDEERRGLAAQESCRRARSHEPGRNCSVRHWLPKTKRL